MKRSRIVRHNSICRILSNRAIRNGWEVWWEPTFDGPAGRLKPDVVMVKGDKAVVVDPTVICDKDARTVAAAANEKESKYDFRRSDQGTSWRPAGLNVWTPGRIFGVVGWIAMTESSGNWSSRSLRQ